MFELKQGPIGVFDSGYGGLTILNEIRRLLPQYDYVYIGDNARSPYGNRSFEVVYKFTREAVIKLFELGCPLVIIGCNTASAKALRSIQMLDLPTIAPDRRVLGVIRPTAEIIGNITKSRHIGILATEGTVNSGSYELEIAKFFPDIKVSSQACPLWAAIVEAGEADSDGAAYFVGKRLDELLRRDKEIDTILLGCTHYPLLLRQISRYLACLPDAKERPMSVLPQGKIVALSLKDYLSRHKEMEVCCQKGGTCRYLTTESAARFAECARTFLSEDISAEHIALS